MKKSNDASQQNRKQNLYSNNRITEINVQYKIGLSTITV